MTEPTLKSIKDEIATAEAEKAEAARLERKRSALTRLAATEERLNSFVERVTKRREDLKADKKMAKEFLDVIGKVANEEDLDVDQIETILQSIELSMNPLNCHTHSYANGGHAGSVTINISAAELDEATGKNARKGRARAA